MRILCKLALIAAISGMTLSAAKAQAPCLEGKTAAGACLDASIGTMMRESVRVFTQPRLSFSGPAVAPSHDHQYDVLRDWRQGLQREIYGPCNGARCP